MNPRTHKLNWWQHFAPLWNTPGEDGGAAAGGEGGDDSAGEGGEGSPPADGGGNQSGDTPPSSSLISDGGDANSDEDAGEGDGDASFVPLTQENIELPEGVEIAEEQMGSFLGLLNNQELSRAELAQGLVDLQLDLAQQAQDAATTAGQQLWEETQNSWREQAQALPNIGGANLNQTLATIKEGLTAMGATKETFAALDVTGAGNHPALIPILHKLTKDLVETPPVDGDAGGDKGKLTHAQIMFGQHHET